MIKKILKPLIKQLIIEIVVPLVLDLLAHWETEKRSRLNNESPLATRKRIEKKIKNGHL